MDEIKEQGKTVSSLANFLASTEKYITQSTEPGDYYKAVWCRDAAYILRDQFVTGSHIEVFTQLKHIWKNQIGSDSSNLIYGRGSPKTEFTPLKASKETIKNFSGALPTTIYDNFSEIYALNPDIDSTALMIYVSSWILVQMINQNDGKSKDKSGQTSEMISFILPYLFRSVDYLLSRDEDSDGLLEQEYNEDWMDTVLRDGKVVYSQGCWLLGLSGFANLLNLIDKKEEARRIQSIAARLINSIESKMWSEKSKCYVNIDSGKTTRNGSSEILYQDIIFYVFAMTEQLIDTSLVTNNNNNNNNNLQNISPVVEKESLNQRYYYEKIQKRMMLALESLRKRIWVRDIPLVTEKPLQKTGPWILQSNEYHNYTHWPWITAIELLTRFRFGQISECTILLSNLLYSDPNNNSNHDRIFYEWLDPRTLKGGGAYPFRTGISAFRLASFEILSKFT